jgi:glycosyltransferase involved in cell wall biosynthesis
MKRRRATRGAGARPDRDVTRVLFLHTATVPPLGADTWIHAQIMRHLDPATHEVHAACVPGPPDRPTPTFALLRELDGVTLWPAHLGGERTGDSIADRVGWALGSLRAVTGLVRLARYIRHRRIDVIHTSDRPRDALTAVLLGRITGATSIIHVHVGYGEWMSRLLKWSLRHADALISISSFVADTLVVSGHDADRLYVVRNGIDPRRWTPGDGRAQGRDEFAVPDDSTLVVTVCRLFPEKGPGLLISALARVAADHPNVRLLVVGQEMVPGYADELTRRAEDLGLADRVVLTGRRNDVEQLMAAADVFAMPSLEEPFGLVFLEAMAMELPVVALRSGGAPEVVDDGVTGLLSPPGDVDALAGNLATIIDDPEPRRLMGKRGRERVISHFTVEHMASGIADVYRAIGRGKVGRRTRRRVA